MVVCCIFKWFILIFIIFCNMIVQAEFLCLQHPCGYCGTPSIRDVLSLELSPVCDLFPTQAPALQCLFSSPINSTWRSSRTYLALSLTHFECSLSLKYTIPRQWQHVGWKLAVMSIMRWQATTKVFMASVQLFQLHDSMYLSFPTFTSNSKSIGEQHWRSYNLHETSSTWPSQHPCAALSRELAARRGCWASLEGGSCRREPRWENCARSGGGESSRYDARGEIWPNRPFIQESSPGKDVDFAVRRSSWEDGLHRGLSSSLKESTVLLDIVHWSLLQ